MAAVLHRPDPLSPEPGRPADQGEMVARTAADRALATFAPLLVTADQAMRALVRVDPDNHHEHVSFTRRGTARDRAGGHSPIETGEARLLSSHTGRSRMRARAAEPDHSQHGSFRASEPAHTATLTLGFRGFSAHLRQLIVPGAAAIACRAM